MMTHEDDIKTQGFRGQFNRVFVEFTESEVILEVGIIGQGRRSINRMAKSDCVLMNEPFQGPGRMLGLPGPS